MPDVYPHISSEKFKWLKKKALSHVRSAEELQPAMEIHEQEIVWILKADQNTACGAASSVFSYAVVCPFWSGHVMSWKYPHV